MQRKTLRDILIIYVLGNAVGLLLGMIGVRVNTTPNRLRATALTLSATAVAMAAFAAQNHTYTARLATIAKVQGKVVVSGFTWHCRDRTCTSVGPWPAPEVDACNVLAKRVGQISSYGRQGRELGGSELKRCNLGIARHHKGTPPRADSPVVIVPLNAAKGDKLAPVKDRKATEPFLTTNRDLKAPSK